MRFYIGMIVKDDDSAYGVIFPDFPGCVGAGENPKEAIESAEEALQFHIDGMVEDGEEIPEPSPLEPVVEGKRKLPKGFCGNVMIPVRVPGPSRRVNITLDSDLLKAIDQVADVLGTTRSGFLALAAREEIRKEKKTA